MIQLKNMGDYSTRRAIRADAKGLCLLVMVAVCSLAPSCKGEAMVSGKPVSHWVAILEDRDKREWFKAFDALRWCNKDDLKGARTRLRQMAVGGNIFSRNAALLLFNKFQEVDPKFADAYLVTNGDETFVWGGSAFKALAGSNNEFYKAAFDAMGRKIARMDGNEKWVDDLLKLTREMRAIREGKP